MEFMFQCGSTTMQFENINQFIIYDNFYEEVAVV
jgi:hypothetical protein